MDKEHLFSIWGDLLRANQVELARLIITAPHRYKHYQIPKRSGGFRDIYHPTPELKTLQHWIASNLLQQLPIHDSVYSYREGRGIKHHAYKHASSNYFTRLDFKNFFPSISKNWVISFLSNQREAGRFDIAEDCINIIATLLCRQSKIDKQPALSIGAPSSPILSNAILYDFDTQVFDYCKEHNIIYTRYADDIFISCQTPGVLYDAETRIKEISEITTPLLKFNEHKTNRTSRKHRVKITGLNITSERKLSAGRELKRKIKTEVFLWKQGTLDPLQTSHLRGLISYVMDVDRIFFNSLINKFGNLTIESIMSPPANNNEEIPF